MPKLKTKSKAKSKLKRKPAAAPRIPAAPPPRPRPRTFDPDNQVLTVTARGDYEVGPVPVETEDLFEIPVWLRVKPEDMPKRAIAWDDYWRNNPPQPVMMGRTAPAAAGEPDDVQKFREQEQERKRQKSLTRINSMQQRKTTAAAVGAGMRWDSNNNRFVKDTGSVTVATLPPVEAAPMARPPRVQSSRRSKPPIDDLVARVKDAVGTDIVKLKAFALANDCWDDKYVALPNPGLVRMNVINRLRARVRKGNDVVLK